MSEDEQWRPMTPTERERNAVIIAEALQETFDRISEMEAKEKADKERIAGLEAQVSRLQRVAVLEWEAYYNIALHYRELTDDAARRYANSVTGLHPGDLDPIGGDDELPR